MLSPSLTKGNVRSTRTIPSCCERIHFDSITHHICHSAEHVTNADRITESNGGFEETRDGRLILDLHVTRALAIVFDHDQFTHHIHTTLYIRFDAAESQVAAPRYST